MRPPALPQEGRRPPNRLRLGHLHRHTLSRARLLHPAAHHLGVEPSHRHDIHTDGGPRNPSCSSGRNTTSGGPPIRSDAASITASTVAPDDRLDGGLEPLGHVVAVQATSHPRTPCRGTSTDTGLPPGPPPGSCVPTGRSPINLMCTNPRPHADSIRPRRMNCPTAKCTCQPVPRLVQLGHPQIRERAHHPGHDAHHGRTAGYPNAPPSGRAHPHPDRSGSRNGSADSQRNTAAPSPEHDEPPPPTDRSGSYSQPPPPPGPWHDRPAHGTNPPASPASGYSASRQPASIVASKARTPNLFQDPAPEGTQGLRSPNDAEASHRPTPTPPSPHWWAGTTVFATGGGLWITLRHLQGQNNKNVIHCRQKPTANGRTVVTSFVAYSSQEATSVPDCDSIG